MNKPRRVYDAPDKGVLWGWEVSGYVLTKAISAGVFLVSFLGALFGWAQASVPAWWWGLGAGLLFLAATGILLIMDLDRPDRFLNVLLRPQWKSWLVRGGYSFSIYGGLLTLLGLTAYFGWDMLKAPLEWITLVFAVLTAVYTAFLFAQAKGRDFWQSPALAVHMLAHSFMAGAAAFTIIALFTPATAEWLVYLKYLLITGIIINLLTVLVELTMTHPTQEAKIVVGMITKGRYRNMFWGGAIFFGNLVPLAILLIPGLATPMLALAGLIVLIGIYSMEKIWVEAPQRVQLV